MWHGRLPEGGSGSHPFELVVLEGMLDEVDATIRAKFATVRTQVLQVQYSSVQYSTVQYSTVQYSIPLAEVPLL